jgi:hypothetical protein
MEAEYVALSSLCHDLFPLIDITQEICSALLLHLPDTMQMHIKIHEDNVSTLIIGQLEPQQMTHVQNITLLNITGFENM